MERKGVILVVDDIEANRYTLRRYLQQAGFEVWEAQNGKEALVLAQQGPDLIILDVKLPDCLGYEVCRKVKENPETARTPVLQISAAFKSPHDKARGLEAGADGFLTGPVDPEELVAHVNLPLRLRQAAEALRQQEEEYRASFELAAVGKAQADPATGRFVRVNESFCQITGFARDEILQKTFSDITHPEDRARDLELYHRLACGEIPAYHLEKRYIRPDNTIVWVHVSVAMARRADQPYRSLAVIQDITCRKETEAALLQKTEQLEAAEAKLKEHAESLSERVNERTAQLARANRQLQREVAERRRAEEGREALLRQLVAAQEEERRRLSRELHDQMGQHLTALGLGLKALKDGLPQDSDSRPRLRQLQDLANQISQELHRLAVELRPTALDDLGLLSTLRNYVRAWSERYGIEADFQALGLDGARLPAQIEITFYRIVQEALNNVAKHARASRISLILEQIEGRLRMIVEDNGCGFDAETAARPLKNPSRLGLLGMQERLAMAGGTFSIESTRGHGTTVFAQAPLPKGGLSL